MPVMRLLVLMLAAALASTAQIRVGIVGTDTSHVIAFVRVLNDPAAKDHIPGARIVAAYKGGSPDIKDSYSGLSLGHGMQWLVLCPKTTPDLARLKPQPESGHGVFRFCSRSSAPAIFRRSPCKVVPRCM